MLVHLLALALAGATPQVDWKSMIPVIRPLVKSEFYGVEHIGEIRITTTADITGDGVPEALVYLGLSGAYTDLMTLMRIEDGKPVVALFKRDGKVRPLEFAIGSSVMNGERTELLPTENAIYTRHYSMQSDGREIRECTGEAYQWNPDTKTFDYRSELSETITRDSCRELAKSFGL